MQTLMNFYEHLKKKKKEFNEHLRKEGIIIKEIFKRKYFLNTRYIFY